MEHVFAVCDQLTIGSTVLLEFVRDGKLESHLIVCLKQQSCSAADDTVFRVVADSELTQYVTVSKYPYPGTNGSATWLDLTPPVPVKADTLPVFVLMYYVVCSDLALSCVTKFEKII